MNHSRKRTRNRNRCRTGCSTDPTLIGRNTPVRTRSRCRCHLGNSSGTLSHRTSGLRPCMAPTREYRTVNYTRRVGSCCLCGLTRLLLAGTAVAAGHVNCQGREQTRGEHCHLCRGVVSPSASRSGWHGRCRRVRRGTTMLHSTLTLPGARCSDSRLQRSRIRVCSKMSIAASCPMSVPGGVPVHCVEPSDQ